MWNVPFDESMLYNPRGVIVRCTCLADAAELESVLIRHGIHDWDDTLEYRYDRCKRAYPNDDVCFRILDRRNFDDGETMCCSAEYCRLGYYEKSPEFDAYIRCTFRSGGGLPELNVSGNTTDCLLI